MYCSKCGNSNGEGENFCVHCGNALNTAATHEEMSQPGVEQKQKRNNKKLFKILIPVVIALAVLAAAAFFVLREVKFRNLGEEIVDNVVNVDIDAMFDRMHKDVLSEEYGNKSDRKRVVDALEAEFEALLKQINNTEDEWELVYQATHVSQKRGEVLESLQEMYADRYDCQVTAAKDVTVTLTTVMDENVMSASCLVTLVKIDGQWYLDHDSAYYLSVSICQFLLYVVSLSG